MSGPRDSTPDHPPSFEFGEVLGDELRSFGVSGKNDRASVLGRAHDARLARLAFSGGGIRSATFNLGVLQALADLALLKKFHYLSTVSGGGYIGSWLIAWIRRRDGNLNEVVSALRTDWRTHPAGDDTEEIRFLRRFSKYLTPKLGWLGADTWTVLAICLRNTLLNLTVLVAALAVVLLLTRAVAIGIPAAGSRGDAGIGPDFLPRHRHRRVGRVSRISASESSGCASAKSKSPASRCRSATCS